jgi:ribonuclease D
MTNLEALGAKLTREAEAAATAEALEAAAELAEVREVVTEAAETPEPQPAPREPEAEARSERIDAHLAELKEASAAQATRDASRDAAAVLQAQAEATVGHAGAWVPGREAPTWRGPENAPEAQPAPETEVEAGL